MDLTQLRSRSLHLLVSMLILLLGHPFVLELPGQWPSRMMSVLTSLVMVAAVWWSAAHRRYRVRAVLLAAPSVVTVWFREDLPPVVAVLWMLFCLYTIRHVFHSVMREHEDLFQRLCAAVSVYMLIAMTFAYLHFMLFQIDPQWYRNTVHPADRVPDLLSDMVYFSFTTITTLGYGDIVPQEPLPRMLAVVEVLTGTFFLAVLIARLVSAHPQAERRADQ